MAHNPTTPKAMIMPVATRPRDRLGSESSTRCISTALSSPNRATVISSWYNAIAAARPPNWSLGRTRVKTGETTVATTICIDQTRT